jgi:hypothetical protein
LTQNEPKGQGCEKRAKADFIPLKEINAPSPGLLVIQLPCGMISFLTLHSVIFFTLFFLRPDQVIYKSVFRLVKYDL